MVGKARRKLVGGPRQAVFHCWTRCVRRAFLCGRDPLTGKDYSYRRRWIVDREEQLAGLFAIDIEFRSEMANHLHLVLRTMPRVAKRWSPQEVARRWLTATKLAKCFSSELPTPDPRRVKQLAKNKKLINKLRRRLSDISWFMGILCENIARRANQEDDCKGRFFESRFRCRECTDLSAVLLCGIYVDLNPYQAGEVERPTASRYTSIHQRLQSRGMRKNAARRPDGWLGELTLPPERKADAVLADRSRTGRRASDLGILHISLEDYAALLCWTARQLREGRRDQIPKDLAAVLDRFHVNRELWTEAIESYESAFGHAIGRPESVAAVAERMDLQHMKGITTCRQVFA